MVYVVEELVEYEYGGYAVVGVYESESDAEKWVEEHQYCVKVGWHGSKTEAYRIEEFELQ